MDPQETLRLIEIYIHKGRRAGRPERYFQDAGDLLEEYWAWRKRGGFEPKGGDDRARELGIELSDAWEEYETEEERSRAIHEGLSEAWGPEENPSVPAKKLKSRLLR